jgi:dTDP-4-amino-4,6-dideoxygalactose transaminase
MITTDDSEVADRIRLLRSHGGVRIEGRFTFTEAGYNYRMSDVNGALGIAQMRRLDGIIAARRALALSLNERLSAIPGIVVPAEDEPGATYQSYVVRLEEGIDRDEIIRQLAGLGIESTIGTYGLHLEPYFRTAHGLRARDLPNATIAARHTLTLPLFPGMQQDDLDRVETGVATVLENGAAS